VAGLGEIGQWVLSMGPEAVVVEPTELKVLIKKKLQAALDHYSGVGDDELEPAEMESTMMV